MPAAIDDLCGRTDVESIHAYIAGESQPSHRLAAERGSVQRGPRRGPSAARADAPPVAEPLVTGERCRFGESMIVYELRGGLRHRRGT
jgi:hypothetical protein